MGIQIKRVYETPTGNDGVRILVDRLWPRGLSKPEARIDFWAKEAAPSHTLRRWYGHDPAKWGVFKKRYFKELEENQEAVEQVQRRRGKGRVTLVYGSKEREFNNAVALKEYLESRL